MVGVGIMAVGVGRTPHGVRGLKYRAGRQTVGGRWSHPTRGAWIEISSIHSFGHRGPGRTPHGVRGLK